MTRAADDAVARCFRAEFGRTVAILARTLGGDVDRAEEAVQDAYAVAVERWPRDGVPTTPGAWILSTAKNRAIDRLRRERTLRTKQALLARELEDAVAELPTEEDAIPDERLELIFACCHPALAADAQVPLTLRLVGGLTVPEIARALLLEEATVQQRIVRAKRKVRTSGIPLAVPDAESLRERLAAVLAVLYLVFNEGYAATTGPALVREDIAGEAIRLARVVVALLPGQPEPSGLLALMLLQHSRRAARTPPGDAGGIVLLADQDRALWDRAQIAEALALLPRALPPDQRPGPYALQAAIAAEHARGGARGGHRLAPARVALQGAGPRAADAGRRAQPRRRGGDGRRPGGRPGARRRARRRARRLPPVARHPRRPPAPPRPSRRRRARLPARARAGHQRARAPLPRRPAGRVRGAGLKAQPPAASIRPISSVAPALLSGSLRLPHFGDCTQDGQPFAHRHSLTRRWASSTSASKAR